MEKWCSGCEAQKSTDDFGSNRSNEDGKETYCRGCHSRYNKTFRAKQEEQGLCVWCSNPAKPGRKRCEECLATHRKRTNTLHKERRAGKLCLQCGAPAAPNKSRCEVHRQKQNATSNQYKVKAFDHYGRVCTCCNLQFIDVFLTLDHVNNDGNLHRKEIKGARVYRWACHNGYPTFLQTHCFNCNMGKKVNGGICPHQHQQAPSSLAS